MGGQIWPPFQLPRMMVLPTAMANMTMSIISHQPLPDEEGFAYSSHRARVFPILYSVGSKTSLPPERKVIALKAAASSRVKRFASSSSGSPWRMRVRRIHIKMMVTAFFLNLYQMCTLKICQNYLA
jgi:hypothetical protein